MCNGDDEDVESSRRFCANSVQWCRAWRGIGTGIAEGLSHPMFTEFFRWGRFEKHPDSGRFTNRPYGRWVKSVVLRHLGEPAPQVESIS